MATVKREMEPNFNFRIVKSELTTHQRKIKQVSNYDEETFNKTGET
jgi:hypothetical protein